jgi:LysM repeat protein
MMKKSRLSLPLGILALLLVASLLTGCFRAAVPDATDTPSSAQQAGDEPAEGTPDIMATGMAESTRVAETTEEPTAAETQPTEAPTALPPTNTPVPATATPSTTAVPTFTPAPSSPTPTPAPTGEVKHTVQAGENLFRIALRYGTTVEAVASANGIANPAMIYVGQVLTISSSGSQQPAPTGGETTHVVQPGDNLFRIALRYNMSYLTLAQYNNIANPASIYVGQVIRIP